MPHPTIQYMTTAANFDDITSILDRDGVICIKRALPKKDLSSLKEELGPHFDHSGFCVGSFFGNKTKRIHSLAAKSATFRDMAVHPLILKIMGYILGPSCNRIQINLTQGIQIWPGERAQAIHCDDVMYPVKTHDCELMVDVMWAYDNFTKENGATVVVPGSHKWADRNRIPREEETVQAEMEAGDCLIYVGSLFHNGGANKADKARAGVLVSYALGWLRQFENQYFAAPPSLAKHFKKELQELLGYAVHRPNLGLYEGNDPSIVFDLPEEKLTTYDWLTPAAYELIGRAQALEDAGKKLPDRLEDLMNMSIQEART